MDGVALTPLPSLAPSQSGLSWTLGLGHPRGSAWSCSLSWPLGIWHHSPGSSLGSLSSCVLGRELLCSPAGFPASQMKWSTLPPKLERRQCPCFLCPGPPAGDTYAGTGWRWDSLLCRGRVRGELRSQEKWVRLYVSCHCEVHRRTCVMLQSAEGKAAFH